MHAAPGAVGAHRQPSPVRCVFRKPLRLVEALLLQGKEVKAFVNTQRPEVIKAIPLPEKVRLLRILLDPLVEDDDLEAVAIIRRNSTPAEQNTEPTE